MLCSVNFTFWGNFRTDVGYKLVSSSRLTVVILSVLMLQLSVDSNSDILQPASRGPFRCSGFSGRPSLQSV